jgi:hypothetical protein
MKHSVVLVLILFLSALVPASAICDQAAAPEGFPTSRLINGFWLTPTFHLVPGKGWQHAGWGIDQVIGDADGDKLVATLQQDEYQQKTLQIVFPAVGRIAIDKLCELKNIDKIWIGRGSLVAGAAIAKLVALPKLRELHLNGQPLTNKTLVAIGKAKQLEVLDLRGSSMSTDGVRQLSDLTTLRELDLSSIDLHALDDAPPTYLGALSRMKKLERLKIGITEISTLDFNVFFHLQSLRYLSLRSATPGVNKTAGTFKILAQLPHLQTLEIDGGFRAPALKMLQPAKQLSRLQIKSDRQQAAAYKKVIARFLPKCVSGVDHSVKLNERTTLKLADVPLIDVVEFLSVVHDTSITLNRKSLEESKISPTTPISLVANNIRLRSALNLILEDRGLSFVPIPDGFEVVSKETLRKRGLEIVKRDYDCASLLEGLDNPAESTQALAAIIKRMVDPDSWNAKSDGTQAVPGIKVEDTRISCDQTRSAQSKIEALLESMKSVGQVTRRNLTYPGDLVVPKLAKDILDDQKKDGTIAEALLLISSFARVAIDRNLATIQSAKLNLEAKTPFELRNEKVSIALDRLLTPHTLSWTYRSETGRIEVSTQAAVDRELRTQWYPVQSKTAGDVQVRLEKIRHELRFKQHPGWRLAVWEGFIFVRVPFSVHRQMSHEFGMSP